ncbi:MAG: transglutaminase-like domain-containing protein [Planctomycetia bacterium]|nr:transglutaminase-like domain-containing protein [Planctomycetia bacterium]
MTKKCFLFGQAILPIFCFLIILSTNQQFVFAQITFGDISGETEESEEQTKRGSVLGTAKVIKYKAGMIFEARPGGTCSNLLGTAPVPMDFPEQKVRILEEEFANSAKVKYRELREGGAKEMVFSMKTLRPGQRVESTVLFEVTRYQQLPPVETDCYSISKKITRNLRQYLRNSPYIETDNKVIRDLAKKTTAKIDSDWKKVEAIFQFVRENIAYKEEMVEKEIRGAVAAYRTKEGDCEDMCALFIAMCRSLNIPARLVHVPGHCYAEFYLVDEKNDGYWFPAQVAGTEPFGGMLDLRVILQKGDCFRLPESPKTETLYVKEMFTGNVSEGAPDPIYQFIQESY